MGQCLYEKMLFFTKVREMQNSSIVSTYYTSIGLVKIKMLDDSSVEDGDQKKCLHVNCWLYKLVQFI